MIKIPLADIGNQSFRILIDSKVYGMTIRRNTRGPFELTLLDGTTPLVQGLPLLGGIDLFAPYPELGLQGMFALNLENIDLDPVNEVSLFKIEQGDI